MKKIKVCHIVSGLKAGGVETMIYNYCSHLGKDRYEFHLLYQHNPSKKNVEEFESIGFKLKRIPSKVKHPIKNYLSTKKYFKENSFDVVHCHMTLMNFIPLIAAKKCKVPIRICHSHNSDVRNKNIFIKFLYAILKKICINNATDLVACGIDAGKYMYGKREFIIINNSLDLKKFEYNNTIREKIRKKYGIEKNEILIGHIGRFTNQKNHKFIINLFTELINKKNTENKNYKLLLIGDGEQKSKVEEMVKNDDLKDKVIFTGVVDNTNEFYSAIDIFILPSLWEGLPVVGIEAQVSGLPCLFSSNIDNNVVLNLDRSYLLNLNVTDWVKKIQEVSNNKYKRTTNIAVFNSKNLNIDKEYTKLKEIYEKN